MQSNDKNKVLEASNASEMKEMNFNGGAVIDAKGREVAITEDMIQSAFEKLAQVSMLPANMR